MVGLSLCFAAVVVNYSQFLPGEAKFIHDKLFHSAAFGFQSATVQVLNHENIEPLMIEVLSKPSEVVRPLVS